MSVLPDIALPPQLDRVTLRAYNSTVGVLVLGNGSALFAVHLDTGLCMLVATPESGSTFLSLAFFENWMICPMSNGAISRYDITSSSGKPVATCTIPASTPEGFTLSAVPAVLCLHSNDDVYVSATYSNAYGRTQGAMYYLDRFYITAQWGPNDIDWPMSSPVWVEGQLEYLICAMAGPATLFLSMGMNPQPDDSNVNLPALVFNTTDQPWTVATADGIDTGHRVLVRGAQPGRLVFFYHDYYGFTTTIDLYEFSGTIPTFMEADSLDDEYGAPDGQPISKRSCTIAHTPATMMGLAGGPYIYDDGGVLYALVPLKDAKGAVHLTSVPLPAAVNEPNWPQFWAQEHAANQQSQWNLGPFLQSIGDENWHFFRLAGAKLQQFKPVFDLEPRFLV